MIRDRAELLPATSKDRHDRDDDPTAPHRPDPADTHHRRAGRRCPYQATGAILGLPFYFRFRNDYASLQTGESETFGIANVTGDDYSGSLTGEEFETLFRKLLKKYLRSLKL